MWHQIFNSVIAILGLVIAAITAWHQFGPVDDQVIVTSMGRLNVGHPISVDPHGGIDTEQGTVVAAVGPVTWKMNVQNVTKRTVSLVSYRVFQLDSNDRLIFNSEMRGHLSPLDASLVEQELPDNLASFETKSYLVSLMLPFQEDDDHEDDCTHELASLSALERCFFRKGRDLFGNRLEAIDVVPGRSMPNLVRWIEIPNGPRFLIVLETADGSTFETTLSYFPRL